jgi:peptidoglycan hydrolase-like protein with peptidoglycan-binding domain
VERLDPKEVEAVRKALNPGLEPPAAPRALGLFEPSHPTAQPSLHISPSFSPQAVDFMDLDPVRRAQRRLHDLGYLHREADIDGVMGPKTRLAARQFQQEKHLKITGELDDVTMSALEIRHSRSLLRPGLTDALHPGSVTPYSRETLDTLRKELGAFNFRITETKSPENVRYRLQDDSSNVIEQSLDRRQLASKLNEILTQNGGKAISIELPDFSQSRTDALASSLTIQFRQVDPSLALSVPAVPTFTAPDPSLSKKPATWVRSSQIVIQRNGSDTYSSRVSFSDVFAKGRSFTLTIVQTSLNVVLDFLDSLGILSRSPIVWSAGSSLQQHVNYARADMKRRHPNLTDRDLQVMITDQAGNTGFVELRIETTFACS